MLRARNHTTPIVFDGKRNVVSIDRVTFAIKYGEATQTIENKHHDDVLKEENNTKDRYVVKRNTRHEYDYDGTEYLVWWYGYSPADDTWELGHHITQNIISFWWER